MRMKHWQILALCLALLPVVPVCAEAVITLGEVPFVTLYGVADTVDGNVLMALTLREEANTRESENLTVACLRCVGANGETLWEHCDAARRNNVYTQPAVAADGSILAAVHHYDGWNDGTSEYLLRRFSPTGELLAEEELPQSDWLLLNVQGIKGALYALYRTTPMEQAGGEMVCVGFDETLRPVATLRDSNTPAARWGEGWLLLDRDDDGMYGASLVDNDGHPLWTRPLSLKKNGTESGMLYSLTENDELLLVTFDWNVETQQPTAVTLTRCTLQGTVSEPVTLQLPVMQGPAAFTDLRATQDGYLLLAVTNTDTRLRALHFSLSGELLGSAEAFVEEDIYHTSSFCKLGGRQYLCAASWDDEAHRVRLFPLDE